MTSQSTPGSQQNPYSLVPTFEEVEDHFRANLPTIVSSYFEMKRAALSDGRGEEEAEVIAMTWVINRSLGVYSSMLQPKLTKALSSMGLPIA